MTKGMAYTLVKFFQPFNIMIISAIFVFEGWVLFCKIDAVLKREKHPQYIQFNIQVKSFSTYLTFHAKSRGDLHSSSLTQGFLPEQLLYDSVTRNNMTGTLEQCRTLSATLPSVQRPKPLRPWVLMAMRLNFFSEA